eukprot:CAMPEP_0172529388 /NCGR_PEP_ID=MMETSP1067-20121228/3479_1 /TAXON_ID=265564 ORGANISM="Thalassiosira punctigera, Strain Tpunct2005C2" /NCGR_SAMPLE_ID=MMETSP1067 /ASSEMBLY_ACC=CAM_ASM_000444 /LENGTH=303 /DNA_ID=CAMNT_0013313429 /DNA_START=200 /DNA_END=1110 /DNA_ORIENTATION=-
MNMNMKQTAAVAVAILAAALAPSLAVAFSPPSPADAKLGNSAMTSTVLEYRSYDGPQFYDVDGERTAGRRWSAAPAANGAASAGRRPARRRHVAQSDSGLYDVDSDRTTLWTLLDPPAPPFVPVTKKSAAAALQTPEARQASLRAASKNAASAAAARRRRPSPIVSLFNVEDYEEHVLHSPNGDNAVMRRPVQGAVVPDVPHDQRGVGADGVPDNEALLRRSQGQILLGGTGREGGNASAQGPAGDRGGAAGGAPPSGAGHIGAEGEIDQVETERVEKEPGAILHVHEGGGGAAERHAAGRDD